MSTVPFINCLREQENWAHPPCKVDINTIVSPSSRVAFSRSQSSQSQSLIRTRTPGRLQKTTGWSKISKMKTKRPKWEKKRIFSQWEKLNFTLISPSWKVQAVLSRGYLLSKWVNYPLWAAQKRGKRRKQDTETMSKYNSYPNNTPVIYYYQKMQSNRL